ncbi:MAG TPA: DUF3570 domain-containing protein [Polyangiales bacterium]|nr:DUF3570 domain-containing protein [Polyangiales bacterium]
MRAGCEACGGLFLCLFQVGCLLLAAAFSPRAARAEDAAGSLYVRTDSDATTVISPRIRANKQLTESTNVDATYAADIWTSASVDIRASASVRPVTEQRDEVDLGLRHELGDVHLRGSYRFSSEHDYTSHGLTVGGAIDLAQNAATVDVSLHVFADTVGQSGNPDFARALTTLDGSLSYTQVLDPVMFMSLTYEIAHNKGYQASPYRYVGVGGTGFGCVGASFCLPEYVPPDRTRHALAFLIRRALAESLSLGFNYRLYLDDWGLTSHTALVDMGINVGAATLLSLRYRFHMQAAVTFYQPVYQQLAPNQYRTRDRELSELTYHRAGAELEHQFAVGDHSKLSATLALSGNFYKYADFKGLTDVTALEISAGLLFQN